VGAIKAVILLILKLVKRV